MISEPSDVLLNISHLSVVFRARGFRKPVFQALRDVSLDIRAGETVGLVGESGSGKTTLGRAVLGLVPASSGSIVFDGDELTTMETRRRRVLASEIQVVFQDPYTSLNPSMTVEDILSEPLIAGGTSKADSRRTVRDLLDQVALPTDAATRLPRDFSGGQRQRVAIARALALAPRFIVCDEPVSALDLSTQSRVLDMLIEIQERTGVAYLFVSHDLAVVRHVSHRVAVMYEGSIVEHGDANQVTGHPEHAYTQRLFMSVPIADPIRQATRRAARLELATRTFTPTH